jgi:hypothetical protein
VTATSFSALLQTLSHGGVDFILAGGVAAAAHGAARTTYDLDVVYSRAPANVARLAEALAPLEPYLRDAPRDLPFRWDRRTIARGLNFTLTTQAGSLDLLGELTGAGTYDDLLPHTIEIDVFGIRCRCLTLEQLIHVKRAAGRPKDFEAIAELEALKAERDHDGQRS